MDFKGMVHHKLDGLKTDYSRYSQCLFCATVGKWFQTKEWGVELAAGHNRNHSTNDRKMEYAAEYLSFATGYLLSLPFHHTVVPVIASWQSTKRRGYPCLYEQGCRYNRPALLKH